MNITKERIDEVFIKATENHLINIKNDFVEAMNQIPEFKNNPAAREVIAASIAQGNVMAAVKEIFYELLTDEK